MSMASGESLPNPVKRYRGGRNDRDENVQDQRAQELDEPEHAMQPPFGRSLVDGSMSMAGREVDAPRP
jgi:hypothetical protein